MQVRTFEAEGAHDGLVYLFEILIYILFKIFGRFHILERGNDGDFLLKLIELLFLGLDLLLSFDSQVFSFEDLQEYVPHILVHFFERAVFKSLVENLVFIVIVLVLPFLLSSLLLVQTVPSIFFQKRVQSL